MSQDISTIFIGDAVRFKEKTGQTMTSQLFYPQQLNTYSYAHNNPFKFKDESGRAAAVDDIVVILVLIFHPKQLQADPVYEPELYSRTSSKQPEIYFGGDMVSVGEPVPLEFGKLTPKSLPEPIFGESGNYIPRTTTASLPEGARTSYEFYERGGWKKMPDYEGGGTFDNKQELLPQKKPGYYREFDANPKKSGQARGTERFVVGQKGEVYYTDTHYGDVKTGPAFQKLK